MTLELGEWQPRVGFTNYVIAFFVVLFKNQLLSDDKTVNSELQPWVLNVLRECDLDYKFCLILYPLAMTLIVL